ncbi:MAG: hypothetical protein M3498_05295 [Deinococcota bacterium]|jgi:hypothetical protein|nr:hypothetical protein [Deinococcota bacterium]
MSLILELPQNLEAELQKEAARLGLPLSEYALRVLTTGRSTRETPKSGAELVAYWQGEGLIGTRSDVEDSQVHARLLRREAKRRVRE